MLQVNVIKNNVAITKEKLAIKNFKQPELVDTVIALDDERKKVQVEFDTAQGSIKKNSCKLLENTSHSIQ